MFCRAKVCVLLMIAGAMTASAASLGVREKSAQFSTGRQMTPSIVRPSEKKAKLGGASQLEKVKVQKIKPIVQSSGKAEVGGFVFSKPADAPASTMNGTPASSEKK